MTLFITNVGHAATIHFLRGRPFDLLGGGGGGGWDIFERKNPALDMHEKKNGSKGDLKK